MFKTVIGSSAFENTPINARLPEWLEPDFSLHPEIMCLPTVVTHPFNFLQQSGLETLNTKPLFLHSCTFTNAHINTLLHLLQNRKLHTPPTPNVHTVLHYSRFKHMWDWHLVPLVHAFFMVKLSCFDLYYNTKSPFFQRNQPNHGWSENNIILMGLITYWFTNSMAFNNTFQNQKVCQLWD